VINVNLRSLKREKAKQKWVGFGKVSRRWGPNKNKRQSRVPIDGFHMSIMVVAPLLPSSFNSSTSFHFTYVKERKKEKDVRTMSTHHQ